MQLHDITRIMCTTLCSLHNLFFSFMYQCDPAKPVMPLNHFPTWHPSYVFLTNMYSLSTRVFREHSFALICDGKPIINKISSLKMYPMDLSFMIYHKIHTPILTHTRMRFLSFHITSVPVMFSSHWDEPHTCELLFI